MGQLFFDEEPIYEISTPYLKMCSDGRTYKPKAICPFNFSNVCGIINELVSLFVWFVDLRPSQQLWLCETSAAYIC